MVGKRQAMAAEKKDWTFTQDNSLSPMLNPGSSSTKPRLSWPPSMAGLLVLLRPKQKREGARGRRGVSVEFLESLQWLPQTILTFSSNGGPR